LGAPGAPGGAPASGWTSGGWSGAPAGPGGPQGHGPGTPAWQPWQAPKPGPVPLRPLGVGEILDGAISLIRTSPKVMLGLTGIVALITYVLSYGLQEVLRRSLDDPPELTDTSSFVAATFLRSAIVATPAWLLGDIAVLVLTGILTFAVSRAVLGERVTIGQAWDGARARLWSLLGASLLLFAAVFALAVLTFGGGLALLVVDAPDALAVLALVVGGLAFVAGLAYLSFTFAITSPVIVLEEHGPVTGLRRAVALLKGIWWRGFGIWLLILLLSFLLGLVLSLPFGIVVSILSATPAGESDALVNILSAVADTLSATVTWPFVAAATTLVYLDIRMRREGLDLALARAAGVAAPQQPPPAPPYGSLPGFPGPQQAPQPPYGSAGPSPWPQQPPPYRPGDPGSR
jgi:hypothetical protein